MICRHLKKEAVEFFESVTLYKCGYCGVIVSDKYEKGFDAGILYDGYYGNEIFGRFVFGIEYLIRAFRFFRAFKIFTINPWAKSVLDVGSGRGFTLYFLKKYFGFKNAVGTQIEKNAFEYSTKELGLNIFFKDLLEINFKGRKFDVITIWHVLEHLETPEKYIRKIRKLLKKGGKLIIEVPNYQSWSRPLTGKYWLGLDLKYHLFFFDKKSLTNMLVKYGFKVKQTHTFSLEYSAFISAQSMISLLTKTEHLFFQFIQTGKLFFGVIPHLFLFITIFPICLLINLFFYKSDRGEVLLVVAQV